MKKSKFTPGPWGFLKYQIRNDYMIYGPEGSLQKIAELSDSSDCESLDRKANAALIAAAPEMFEALELLHYRLTEGLSSEEHSIDAIEDELKECFKALAKARGES